VRQSGGALARPVDRGKALLEIGPALAGKSSGDFEIAQDDGQKVVEVVRDAAGQLPHRFHFLRLTQGLLDPSSFLAFALQRFIEDAVALFALAERGERLVAFADLGGELLVGMCQHRWRGQGQRLGQ
jgi:hypothetical protein